MSAARKLVVVEGQFGSVASAAKAVGERKAPHRLELVQARAAEPAAVAVPRVTAPAMAIVPEGEVAFYRKYTEAMLSRYLRLSMETGRVPSLLGQEMFRGQVTRGRVRSFEDVVVFVYDMENCLKVLDQTQRYLLRRIALEGHTQQEVAGMTGMSLRTIIRRYWEALDALTRLLLDRRLMEPALAGGLR